MMQFPLYKYGLIFRLVEEADAAFILNLRTNEKLARHLSKTENDLQKQVNWIKEYKEREIAGKEYYFLYADARGNKLGVCRLYNIDRSVQSYTSGSWLAKPGIDLTVSIKADLFLMQFAFETLKLKICNIDVRKDNKKVLRYHKQFFTITGDDHLNIYLTINYDGFKIKEAYLKSIIIPNSN